MGSAIVDSDWSDEAGGLTAKQDAFALAVAKGSTLSDAYRSCYNVTTDNPATTNQAASRLLSNPKVEARVQHYLKVMQDRMIRDAVAIRRHVFRGLMRESEDMEKGSSMSRLKALELLGKIDIVSMFKDKAEAVEDRKPEEIEADIRARLRALMVPTGHNKDRSDEPGEAGEE